uniref:ubiquitinyl hydrolase 1 n=1 Tax=Capra hircus TaxID=9925 RepID=A0A452FFB8_CAPHI
MAERATRTLCNLQYIFGDFSPDEFNQFSVTLHALERPPHGGTVLCGTQAAGDLPDGHNYQRIEYVVNEVIEPSDTLPRTPNYGISNTLNPQGPEFVLSCTTSKKLPDDIDKEVNYSSVDCPALALDGSSHAGEEVIENEGISGSLRQECKKKKPPPGYYSHLKWSPGPAFHNSVGTENADLMGIPQNTTDFISDATPHWGFPRALDSGSRTAEQDTLLRTAVAQPSMGTETTESLGVTKGQILESLVEGTAANGVELHTMESLDSALKSAGMVPTSQPAKSWVSFFHDSNSLPPPQVKEGLVPVSEDPEAIKIAEFLENTTLIHKLVSLQPSTLQVLVACPPIYHLMKFIPLYSKVPSPCTSTPMTDSFFTNMPVPPKPRQALGDKIMRDIHPRAAFEPTYICRLLTVIKWSPSVKDEQEDAEEYLGFILNGLHEEMLNQKKLLSPNNENLTVSSGPKSHSVNEEDQEEPEEGSEDEWENKTSVTHQAAFVQAPIAGIFAGHIRSVSSKESATRQLFFNLQLDIQSNKIRTVQDAMGSLVARESGRGDTTKTEQEMEISWRVTLEKLFYGAVRSSSEILLSPGLKNKNFKRHRAYRLFAVVYHHSSSAMGGHGTSPRSGSRSGGTLMSHQPATGAMPTEERAGCLLHHSCVDLL